MVIKERVAAVILAAGLGSRMGIGITKQRAMVMGRSVLYHAVKAFEDCPDVDYIVVVVREDEVEFAKSELEEITKLHGITVGADCRAGSAAAGFSAIPEESDIVAIHDAARILITPEKISSVVSMAATTGAATAVSFVTDTIKCVDEQGVILSTVDRSNLRRAETPQAFFTGLYAKAISAVELDASITDDNMLMERMGVVVTAVDVGSENLKITTAADLSYAEYVLKKRSGINV